MVHEKINNAVVCVVGLGYVGYPLAEAFSSHLRTLGYDNDRKKFN
jgi:UDPglucose 6-dehydrogenase/UDP-N-acetyl-D-galactosamine dehydrogenase